MMDPGLRRFRGLSRMTFVVFDSRQWLSPSQQRGALAQPAHQQRQHADAEEEGKQAGRHADQRAG
jgi:hypothetical protein